MSSFGSRERASEQYSASLLHVGKFLDTLQRRRKGGAGGA